MTYSWYIYLFVIQTIDLLRFRIQQGLNITFQG